MIRYGDLQLLPNQNDYLIISCDSAGGIGNKEKDIVKIEPEQAGYFAAFVPIVEVLAAKGNIISIVDTLCVEMEPTGKRIISGIKDLMKACGLDPELLTGSTEDNIPTFGTGIGLTVIGSIPKHVIDDKVIPKESELLLVGLPKVGQEFMEEEIKGKFGETLTLELMTLFSKNHNIVDMIPVGSKGIKFEASVLAKRHHRCVRLNEDLNIDYNKSGGPSTCLLVVIDSGNVESFMKEYQQIPIHRISRFLSS